MSNSKQFLDSIPPELVKDGDKEITSEFERVLGLFWNPKGDNFSFALKFHKVDPDIVRGRRTPTKREVLKLLMSIYDPLGFLAPFTVRAKILLQDVWRSDIGWDDILPDNLTNKWTSWIEDLDSIAQVKIPRCYCYEMRHATERQLHLFCDSSEKAFSAVAYLRTQTPEKVDVAFVVAKTRVAPLRPMSMPRLELQAAIMAARLATTVKGEHELNIDHVHYWSDSTTVLHWLNTEARFYKTFVAHRVGEIQEVTNIMDWHWIPSKLNPADDATRDTKQIDISHSSHSSRWLRSPEFLLEPESNWPSKHAPPEPERDEEIELRPNLINLVIDENNLPKVDRFSSWLKLIRSTAWMMRFIKNHNKKIEKRVGELIPSELELAQRIWTRQVQWQSFQEELTQLTKKLNIKKSSRVYHLSPYLDGDGVMRVKSRLQNAELSFDTKNPIILDSKQHYTKLLINFYHVRANHQGREKVLNDLRQSYWILRARAAVKSSWNSCQHCKIYGSKPQIPEMGQLPYARVQVPTKPFQYCGIDYFGPMTVTIGRRREKRYGVLFTCLSTRAVHLEIAPSLTTDSAINAIRRMINRRGSPSQMYSDNGTNLRGADKELQKSLDSFDQEQIIKELTSRKN